MAGQGPSPGLQAGRPGPPRPEALISRFGPQNLSDHQKGGNITNAQGCGFWVSVAEWSTGAKNGDKNHIAGNRTQARTFPHNSSDGKQNERNGTTV